MDPFQSASINAASGGKLVFGFILSQRPHLAGGLFSDPFQSASIIAASASGGKLVFGSFSHLAGGLFLDPFQSASLFSVPFQSVSFVVAFCRHFFHIYTC